MKTPSKEEIKVAARDKYRFPTSGFINEQREVDKATNNLKRGFLEGAEWMQEQLKDTTPQSEVMTLEECKNIVAGGRQYKDWDHLQSGFTSVEGLKFVDNRSNEAAELYASQFKAKSEQLRGDKEELIEQVKVLLKRNVEQQDELEQVKAERDALFSLLKRVDRVFIRKDLSNVGAYYELTETGEAVNKALQSTKQ